MRDPRDYIIFPLDVATRNDAEDLVRQLAGRVGLFKIGLELFIRSGPDLIRWVRAEGDAGIFLDLKLHDIPMTVSRAMAGIVDLQVDMATVHCGAGGVWSGREAQTIKRALGPDFLAVTPGIRPAWESVGPDDQQRVMTPAEAVRSGADYIVIGRPIRDAADPARAARRVADEVAEGLA